MKQILILSGKGGTGKTTTAAAFIRFTQAKAIADCDVDAPNLHIVAGRRPAPAVSAFMGGDKAAIDPEKCTGCGECERHCRFGAIVNENGRFSVNEYACEGCGVCAYVCGQGAASLHTDEAGTKELYTDGEEVFSTAELKMGRGNSGKLVSEVKMDMLSAAPEAQIAVIDGSPGIGCPVIASMSGVDIVLAVAEPSLSGRSDLERLIKTAQTFRIPIAVCVNKWDVSPENTQAIEDFCAEKQIPFAGKIPYDRSAGAAINAGLSLADIDCPARDALREIFENTSRLLAIGKEPLS